MYQCSILFTGRGGPWSHWIQLRDWSNRHHCKFTHFLFFESCFLRKLYEYTMYENHISCCGVWICCSRQMIHIQNSQLSSLSNSTFKFQFGIHKPVTKLWYTTICIYWLHFWTVSTNNFSVSKVWFTLGKDYVGTNRKSQKKKRDVTRLKLWSPA